jgi:hypothetical protein
MKVTRYGHPEAWTTWGPYRQRLDTHGGPGLAGCGLGQSALGVEGWKGWAVVSGAAVAGGLLGYLLGRR